MNTISKALNLTTKLFTKPNPTQKPQEAPPNAHNHNLKVPKHNLTGRFPSLARLPKEDRDKLKYWSDFLLVGLTVLHSRGLARGLAPSVLHNPYKYASGAVTEEIDSHTAQNPTQPKNAPPLQTNKLMKITGLTHEHVNILTKKANEFYNTIKHRN